MVEEQQEKENIASRRKYKELKQTTKKKKKKIQIQIQIQNDILEFHKLWRFRHSCLAQ
jgi:hypothetical protein